MTIIRKELFDIIEVLKRIKTTECNSTQIKYNIIKFEKILQEEVEIASIQLNHILEEYGERDENNQLVFNDGGGVKIDVEKALPAQEAVEDYYECILQVPDFYFSLEELDNFNLNWNEIEILYKFIK
jgi:hypothetical protein